MTDLQGAVGIVQLSKLDSFIEERQRWANYYSEGTWLTFHGFVPLLFLRVTDMDGRPMFAMSTRASPQCHGTKS